jgi:hypothetical protein
VAKVSPIRSSFNAGELSPQLRGRVDLDKYKNGCERLENLIPQIFGPARKRPGTRFVLETADSSKLSRLIPFEFSATQAFAIEFGDETIRFFGDGGVVLDGGSPYEIVSPYADTELSEIRFAQSADVVYLTHPNHAPHKLSRLSATSWTLTPIVFARPPFNDQNTSAITITASGATGSVTLTASASTFVAEDVGSYFSLSIVLPSTYDQWTSGISYTSGASIVHYLGRAYLAASTGTAGARPPIHTTGTESDGAVNWTFLHDGTGYAEVTAYTSATQVTATVISYLPTTAATTRWAEGAWSDRRGWPRAVTFYEDRLWFGGSEFLPQTLWASTTGDYENHTYGTNDDDALNYTINTQDLNTITWLSSGKVLAIGTTNGEFTISGNQISDAITPTNVKITPQTTYGSTAYARPVRIAGSTLFIQKAGRKVREYTYNFETDAYVAPNLTLLSEHITETGIVDLTYQQEPNQIVWVPLASGELLGMTYERAENVVGWHRQPVGGSVESVVALPHWDADQDVLWMIVRRTIDGQAKRYVEYMEKYLTGDYSFYVDCGLTYDGAATTTLTGLDHLEGETVDVLADGAVHPRRTVTGGEIALQVEASVVNVGIPYTSKMILPPFEAGAQDGTSQGKTQRINGVVLRLFETGPGLFYGGETTMDELHLRGSGDAMDAPVPLFSGDTEILPFPEGYEKGARIVIEHRLPLPCTIVAVMPQLQTYDR